MKIRDKGYWVSKLFYVRSWIHWLVSSVKFQSITFFSAVNPALQFGGMLDDRKSDVYKLIPDKYLPKTISLRASDSNVLSEMQSKGLLYPLIIKPDVGFKGFMVRRVENEEELLKALGQYDGREVLIQEFLNHPKEFSILYYRLPHSGSYGISSFVEKTLPYVTGDGKSTLGELINREGSAFLDKKYILDKRKDNLDDIIPKGEKFIVDHVGNYARGSKFYSRNDQIDDDLIAVGNQFFSHLNGINFGRIDLKSDSVGAIKADSFKVLEINGAKAEPLHMYEPTYTWHQVWKAISEHWTILNKIVQEQLNHSFSLPTAKEGIAAAKSLKRQTSH